MSTTLLDKKYSIGNPEEIVKRANDWLSSIYPLATVSANYLLFGKVFSGYKITINSHLYDINQIAFNIAAEFLRKHKESFDAFDVFRYWFLRRLGRQKLLEVKDKLSTEDLEILKAEFDQELEGHRLDVKTAESDLYTRRHYLAEFEKLYNALFQKNEN